MKSRPSNRVHSKHRSLCDKVSEVFLLVERRATFRSLICESLERRYAFYGIGGLDDGHGTYELASSSNDGSDCSEQFRFLASNGQWLSQRPEPKITDDIAGSSEIEPVPVRLVDHAPDSPCDHQPELVGEGEPPVSLDSSRNAHGPGRGQDTAGDRTDPPRLVGEIPASRPGIGIGGTSGATDTVRPIDSADPAPKEPLTQGGRSSGQSAFSNSGLTATTFTLGSVNSNLAGLSLTTNLNSLGAQSGFNPSKSATELSPLTTPLTSAPNSGLSISSSQSELSLRSETSNGHWHDRLKTDIDKTSSISAIPSAWARANDRKATDTGALTDRETDGLLEQLQSVVHQLDSDSSAEKMPASIDRRVVSSHRQTPVQETVGDGASAVVRADGMLELISPEHASKVSSVPVIAAGDATSLTHHSQLLASLELNHEFELAGQSVRAMKPIIEPALGIAEANEPTGHVAAVGDSGSSVATAGSSDGESPIWQRSLLPLSFLAIGGILFRRRHRRPS